MKKVQFIALLLGFCLLFAGCLPKKKLAALQIDSQPTASIFIDGKHVGQTPYVNREMKPGEISLKLIPESTASALSSWEGKLKLVGGVLSVVGREFSEQEDFSSGDILTLEPISDKKSASLAVVTAPDGAAVRLDEENRGQTPLILDKINEGEHLIVMSLEGYKERTLKARTINGFKLIINSKMAKVGQPEAEVTPTGTVSPGPTAKATPKTGPTSTTIPRPTVALKEGEAYVQVKETPTGWLRVRSEPSLSGTELAKVNPGEKYPLLEEQTGWYKIEYLQDKEGWISSQYAEKFE